MTRPSSLDVARAKQVLKDDRQARNAGRPPRGIQGRAFPGRGRQLDPGYLAWLHDWECVACLVLGNAPWEHHHIEAAHQKAQDAGRGWHKLLGRRVSDRQACGLCAYHHRLGPLCCDPAQGKFWAVLGIDVVDFCEALYAAFRAGEPATPIIRRFAAQATIDRRIQPPKDPS